jgi:3-hydroxyacyl-CoA dehydrogenase
MRIADRVCELGRFGQKTGLGWYRYEAGKRDAIPDPAIDTIIKEERASLSITPRKIADGEIVDRLVFALVNEGAQLLGEGIAQRASDIDVVYLSGYGFPPQRGGPMFYASRVGLGQVVRRMGEFAALAAARPGADASFWKPARLLATLAAQGRNFDDSPSSKSGPVKKVRSGKEKRRG